jgi:beta-galactosidase
MHLLVLVYVCLTFFTYVVSSPVTYEDVRGTPYTVTYDHRAIKINNVRTMLIAGAIHYPRSTPGMWPYIMKMAKDQGLNTVQTYVFWNIHEQRPGVLDFSGRANLSKFLQDAADAGLFVNLRIGPYVCAEWNYGGLPAWLNQVPNIAFRSHNPAWEAAMYKFVMSIVEYVNPYLAKNGGPIILAQIENEFFGDDQAYVDWCGDLVTHEFSSMQIPWIMCNGHAANSTIETCNSCNCLDDGWVDRHLHDYPDKPMLFTENEGWFQQWGDAFAIRTTPDLAYSVAEWFAAGGSYHSYYMWHGGNNYGRTAASGITTIYADDVCLHADGTPNEPKYTQLSRLQHLVANNAEVMLSQNSTRTPLPWWDGTKWESGTQQYVYSYPPALHFVGNQNSQTVSVLFRDRNITLSGYSTQIFDDKLNLLWNSAYVADIPSDNTEFFPVVIGPLEWKTWSEPVVSNLPVLTSPNPIEQLKITNDETVYLWYRRNVTLTQAHANSIVQVQTRKANALLFFLDGEYLGEFDNHDHAQGSITATVALDLSTFKPNQQYLFEILSISLGIDNGVWAGGFEYKGIVGNVWINDQLFVNDETNLWEHQKGLVGEYFQIYTEQGSSKVDWNTQWTKGINKPITWFQARFDLDHIVREDLNANPLLLDAQGLNRGHAFINGNDLGLYWLIQGVCHDAPCCCQQAQINCMEPTQRYYHIPSDWLMPKDNLITVFDDLGAQSPGSVGFVQRVIIA